MSRRVERVALLAVLTTACVSKLDWGSDPYGDRDRVPCLPGNARVDGRACVVPEQAIAIDGQVKDWDAVPAIAQGDVTLQLAMSPSDAYGARFALRVQFAGGPPWRRDPTARAVIELLPTDARTPLADGIELSSTGIVLRKGHYPVEVVDAAAFEARSASDDSVEVAIARALLSTRYGASIRLRIERDGASPSESGELARACFSPADLQGDTCAEGS